MKSPAYIAAVGTKEIRSDWILAECRSLIAAEEEQFVLHDRPASRSAELVALDRVASGRKEIPRIEFSVTNEFEQIAVKFIRAGLRHQAYGACRLAASRSRSCAGFDFEFLKSIRKWCGHISVALRIVVICAVQGETQSGVQSAGDRETGFCERIAGGAINQRSG